MSEMEALTALREAAVDWAGGGEGQPLVDAAARALADGVDSTSLRMLAGAPRVAADEEASALAPSAFEELGLVIEPRLSPTAMVEGARQRARRFLEGDGSARTLARDLWSTYARADWPEELAAFSGLDDGYDLLDGGVVEGSFEELDAAVRAAATELVATRPPLAAPRGNDLVVREPSRRGLLRRVRGGGPRPASDR